MSTWLPLPRCHLDRTTVLTAFLQCTIGREESFELLLQPLHSFEMVR